MVNKKLAEFTLEEVFILVDAIGEWRGYLESVDINRKDIDPKLLEENKRKAKDLSTKLWTIKCGMEDREIERLKKSR